MLNPTEGTWPVFKSDVKCHVPYPSLSVLDVVGRGNLAQTVYRQRELEKVIARNLIKIAVSKFVGFITNVQMFILPALELEDMEF